ncbi:hypothetical protein [Litoreibacter meonggei]|nr:hypothetical protein [Litoreibacter meonggei]
MPLPQRSSTVTFAKAGQAVIDNADSRNGYKESWRECLDRLG